MIYNFIGSNLKAQRKKCFYTLEKLANEAETSKGYLHDLESGRVKKPSANLILSISKILNVPFDDFFEKNGDKNAG